MFICLQVWGSAAHTLPGCVSRLGTPGGGHWWGEGSVPPAPSLSRWLRRGELAASATGALSPHWAGLGRTGSAATDGWAVG